MLMKRKWKLVLTAVAIGIGGIVVLAMRKGDGAQELRRGELQNLLMQPRRVRIEQVRGLNTAESFAYPAVIEAEKISELAFRVSGPLIAVDVVLGQPVAQGERLMQIDPRDYEDKIATLTSALKGAQAALSKAEADYNRAKSLRDDKVISPSEYDAVAAQRDVGQAQVDELLASLSSAQHALADTTLTAPFAGTVTQQKIENFEMVTAGKPVLTLLDNSSLDVVIDVPEEDMSAHALQKGALAKVRIVTVPDRVFDAAVKEWSPQADALMGTYKVTFSMKVPEDLLVFPGMTAEVVWSPRLLGPGALVTVPVAAVCRNNGSSAVWVYDADTQTAHKQVVEIGRVTGAERIVILKGLKGGDEIVTAGANYVQPDMKLMPMTATALD